MQTDESRSHQPTALSLLPGLASLTLANMLRIENLLAPECVRQAVPAHSRKRALDLAADLLAAHYPGVPARRLFEALMERERLGSTGIGAGVAIPHCRLECPRMMAAFFSLQQAVDYDAPDDQPVDLVFVLVVPLEETTAHLEVLALLSSVFGDPAIRARLRGAAGADELGREFLEAAGRRQGAPA